MRRTALVAVIALLAGSSCSLFERDDLLSEMTLERRGDAGVLRVVHEGETFEVDDRRRVEPGDVIKTLRGAQARLRLEGNREIWLADNTTVEVIDTDAVGDESGTVLADVDDPTTVMFGDIQATTANGVFRIDRLTSAARAGVYDGSVGLDAPGQPRVQVDSYFQAPVAAGRIGTVTPYQLATADEWDRLWLEEIVALDDQLRQLADGFSSQIGRARPNLSYFQGVSGVDENVGVVESYLDRRPADLLIAFTIADTDDARPFRKSFSRAFALHDDGAAWGLAVAIMEVRSRAMVAQLQRLIIGTGAVAGGAGDGFSFVAGGGAAEGPGAGPGSDTDGSGPSADDDSGNPDPGGDGGDGDGGGGDGGGDGGDCENIIDCTIQDPPIPLPDPSPDDSIVDDLLP